MQKKNTQFHRILLEKIRKYTKNPMLFLFFAFYEKNITLYLKYLLNGLHVNIIIQICESFRFIIKKSIKIGLNANDANNANSRKNNFFNLRSFLKVICPQITQITQITQRRHRVAQRIYTSFAFGNTGSFAKSCV